MAAAIRWRCHRGFICSGRRYDPELTESFPLGAVTLSCLGISLGATVAARRPFAKGRHCPDPLPSGRVLAARADKRGWARCLRFRPERSRCNLRHVTRDWPGGDAITVDAMNRLKGMLIDRRTDEPTETRSVCQMSRAPGAFRAARLPVWPHGHRNSMSTTRLEPAEGALRLRREWHDMQYCADDEARR